MLALHDLACARGGVPILEGVSLSVRAGEALILRGPNGCGKTTLLRTIAGLQPALSGAIEVDPEAIAYGAHADGLKATLTVTENLAFWAGAYGEPNKVDAALQTFALDPLRHRPAQSLSAGQKRRLGLARLLVTGRALWVLDEPTVSLDAFNVQLFASVLQTHLQGGGAALIATHIDLGIEAQSFDLSEYRAKPMVGQGDLL
ncbi:ABC transporter involved in cytochrome c biogenesis, ATPase component CcmA [Candidatus Rhodobacter oscarellae]|uniref:ABC transporter involved in cytochrome c biogenesis, ATPase component CcmA n=2 Tax=Candidatus Rhodobacter oscarellae TaxID=1675527 RepID=A0A0J9GRX2_9RHOB|nr:ABC transporter involved in cytochrome c biogenesis, ATPase component CcmA [Candidatus Rhodobacter lobularis]